MCNTCSSNNRRIKRILHLPLPNLRPLERLPWNRRDVRINTLMVSMTAVASRVRSKVACRSARPPAHHPARTPPQIALRRDARYARNAAHRADVRPPHTVVAEVASAAAGYLDAFVVETTRTRALHMRLPESQMPAASRLGSSHCCPASSAPIPARPAFATAFDVSCCMTEKYFCICAARVSYSVRMSCISSSCFCAFVFLFAGGLLWLADGAWDTVIAKFGCGCVLGAVCWPLPLGPLPLWPLPLSRSKLEGIRAVSFAGSRSASLFPSR